MTEEKKVCEPDKPTCFVLMPISDISGYETGHFARVYEHLIKPSVIEAGYKPIRADDTNKTDYIVVGIIQKIVESAMVICDLSARNPNVMYELGIRHAFNKPVTLIKDKKTDKVFDIQGLRYVEYDESLRIDSVQKEMAKISAAVKETANANPNSFNSVVHLAGIKAAEVPAGQTVSPDTQLLLSAIAAVERRIDVVDNRSKARYFQIKDDTIIFSDEMTGRIGDTVYDDNSAEIGKIVDIHPAEEKIFVRQQDGKVIPFSASSIKAKGMTTLPF
jgi:hypothetical protein